MLEVEEGAGVEELEHKLVGDLGVVEVEGWVRLCFAR